MKYANHKEIPLEYRRVILDETLSKRVSKIPIDECNEIIEDYLEFQESNAALLNYEIQVSDGRKLNFRDPDEAFRALDAIIGVYPHKRTDIIASLRQADRLIRAYVKGSWYTPKRSIYS
jgi:hypothetical protein